MPDKPPEKIWINLDPERAAVQSPWREKLFDDDVQYILASQVAAEIEKVWEQVGVVLSGFGRQVRKEDIIAKLEAARTADIKESK